MAETTDAPAALAAPAADAAAELGTIAQSDRGQLVAAVAEVCALVAAHPPEASTGSAVWKFWEDLCVLWAAAHASGSIPQVAADLMESARRQLAETKTRPRGLKPVVTRLRTLLGAEQAKPELEAWRQRALARAVRRTNLSAPTGVHVRLGADEVKMLLNTLTAGALPKPGAAPKPGVAPRTVEATFAETVDMFNASALATDPAAPVRSANTVAAWFAECILAPSAGVQSPFVYAGSAPPAPRADGMHVFMHATIEAHIRKRNPDFAKDVRAQADSLVPTTAAQQAEQAREPKARLGRGEAQDYEPEDSGDALESQPQPQPQPEAEPEPAPEPAPEASATAGASATAARGKRKRTREADDEADDEPPPPPPKRARRKQPSPVPSASSDSDSSSDSNRPPSLLAQLRDAERQNSVLVEQLIESQRAQKRAQKALALVTVAMQIYNA